MRRVIVVEDERQGLAGSCRGIRERRDDWDMAFTTGAGAAIAACQDQPADAVVIDLGALGMSGLELLTYMRNAYPETPCIVLTGLSEPEMTYRALPRAQRCLMKPVDESQLEGSIERTLNLRDRIKESRVADLLGNGGSLPVTPVYSRLSTRINDDDATTGELADVVAQDDEIVARILELVNSSFFGLSTRAKDPIEAITILGPTTLRALVLNLELMRAAHGTDCSGLDAGALESHALAAATVASRLVEGTNAWNHARVAGLLHDVGRIVLAVAAPDRCEETLRLVAEEGYVLNVAETEVFGFTHADVGAYAANLWGLPWNIVEPIAVHHDESPVWFDDAFDERHAVYVAELLLTDAASRETASVDQLTVALAAHGLEKELEDWKRTAAECQGPLAAGA